MILNQENLSPFEELLNNSPEDFEDAIKRGVICDEIVIHKNTHPLLRKYGANGEISLFYMPEPPTHKIENYILKKGNVITVTTIDKKDTLYAKDDEESNRKVRNYLKSVEKYPIPSNKVNAVFDMIEAGKQPTIIVKYLSNQKTK